MFHGQHLSGDLASKPLHSKGIRHNCIDYKDNEHINTVSECKSMSGCSYALNCDICKNEGCTECFIILIKSEIYCRDCWLIREYKCIHILIELIYKSSFRSVYNVNEERNIIAMMAYFALDYKCSRHEKPISFHASFERGIIHPGLIKDAVEIEYLKKQNNWYPDKIINLLGCNDHQEEELIW